MFLGLIFEIGYDYTMRMKKNTVKYYGGHLTPEEKEKWGEYAERDGFNSVWAWLCWCVRKRMFHVEQEEKKKMFHVEQ